MQMQLFAITKQKIYAPPSRTVSTLFPSPSNAVTQLIAIAPGCDYNPHRYHLSTNRIESPLCLFSLASVCILERRMPRNGPNVRVFLLELTSTHYGNFDNHELQC